MILSQEEKEYFQLFNDMIVGKHSVNPVFQLVSSGATFVAKSYVESKIICVSLFPLRE